MCAKTIVPGEPRLRVTHQQISEQVGVSRAVVTKALHGTGGARMNEQTRQAILRAAQEMGYRPRNVTTHNIAYVVPVEALELQGEVTFLRCVERALRARGYRLTLMNLEKGDAAGLFEMLNPKVVDGAIFMRWPREQLSEWFPLEVPLVVTADDDGIDETVDQVTMDSSQTLRRLTDYVLGFGHKRLLLVSGPGGIGHNERIKDGVRQSLAAAGLAPSSLLTIESSTDMGVTAPLQAAMKDSVPPTAVIADSPEKAMLTLNLLARWGYQVPRDISLAVVLENRQFNAFEPPLTATTALGSSVAEKAVEQLIARINNPARDPRKLFVPGEIIERASVAPPLEI